MKNRNHQLSSRFIDTLESRQLMAVPEVPDGFSASLTRAGSSTLWGETTLTWRDRSTNETGFLIQRRIARKDATWGTVGTAAANETTFKDTRLPGNGKLYTYRIRAMSTEGDSVRGFSDIIDPRGPLSPISLSLSAPLSNQARLSWNAPSNDETAFLVERRRLSTDLWQRVAVRQPTSIEWMGWTDFNVPQAGTEWQYRVFSKRNTQWNPSNVAFITTPATNPTTMPTVGNLTATRSGNGILLTWTDPTDNETGFAIQRRVFGTTDWMGYYGFGGINSTQFYDPNPAAGFTYEYNVLTDGEGLVSADNIVRITV